MVTPVPTVAELVKRGLARPVGYTGKGAASHYQISPEGQALIYAAQASNAAEHKDTTHGH